MRTFGHRIINNAVRHQERKRSAAGEALSKPARMHRGAGVRRHQKRQG